MLTAPLELCVTLLAPRGPRVTAGRTRGAVSLLFYLHKRNARPCCRRHRRRHLCICMGRARARADTHTRRYTRRNQPAQHTDELAAPQRQPRQAWLRGKQVRSAPRRSDAVATPGGSVSLIHVVKRVIGGRCTVWSGLSRDAFRPPRLCVEPFHCERDDASLFCFIQDHNICKMENSCITHCT